VKDTLPPRSDHRPKPRDLHASQLEGRESRSDRQNVTEHRIRASLAIIAELLQYSDAYLPIFLRLEAELAAAEARRAALERARAFLDPSR
jgi:hypothetical protein